MITIISAALAIGCFLFAFSRLGILARARAGLEQVAAANKVIRDATLSDEQKEQSVQRAALNLLRVGVSIMLRSAVCLGASAIPVVALSALGLTDTSSVTTFLSRWDVIAITSVVVGGGTVWASKRKERTAESDYSALDRSVHKLAFYRPFVQLTAADIEDSIFSEAIQRIPDRPPVFITSLPRAGTTILLSALNKLPQVASHSYRDMPFVMSPLLWSRFSHLFAKDSQMKERAHGDGIQVGYDSPEAFEEVLWHTFWPGKYHADHVDLWRACDLDCEATDFFLRHFRKIILLRGGANGRYVSKNNGNIARLDLIPQMFPGASIVVPVRDPLEQAASLLRQHKNFLVQHAQDPFVARYMADIGHWEFGHLHRPFGFDGVAELIHTLTPLEPDYWLTYWIIAYREVQQRANRLHIVTQDTLGASGQQTMEHLCHRLAVDPGDTNFTGHFRAIQAQADSSVYSDQLVSEATHLYQQLVTTAAQQLQGCPG